MGHPELKSVSTFRDFLVYRNNPESEEIIRLNAAMCHHRATRLVERHGNPTVIEFYCNIQISSKAAIDATQATGNQEPTTTRVESL